MVTLKQALETGKLDQFIAEQGDPPGDEEAFNYPAEGLAKFQNGLGGLLELAYENPAIRIFHVIPDDELAAASASAQ